jgi:cobalt/nickel transport system permease protein
VILFAMHLSDGVVPMNGCLAGFLATAVLIAVGLRRLREEDLPKIALVTAAFFVTSVIHLPLGITSVHAVMTGLVGAVLGPYAGIAIFVGLVMQAILLGHGGFTTLGVNTVSLAVPALLFGVAFRRMLTWSAIRRGSSIRYALSVALGAGTLLVSLALQSAVLYLTIDEIPAIAGVWFLAHAILAVIEGILTAGIVDFLLRVKPELLGLPPEPNLRTAVEPALEEAIPISAIHSVVGSGNTSSSETSH